MRKTCSKKKKDGLTLSSLRILGGWIGLLAYLVTFTMFWQNGLSGGIFAFTSHKSYVTYDHGEKHLILKHVEDREKHHHHAIDYKKNIDDHHTEHEFHLIDYERLAIKIAYSRRFPKTFIISHHLSYSSKITFDKGLLPQPQPLVNPTLACLNTTILLI